MRWSILLLALFVASCGNTSTESNTNDIDDIVSMQVRADGDFDVVCRDGSREIATTEDIRSGRVCSGGGGGSGNLICVARDNDNRAPWVFARFTDDGRIVKINGYSFDSQSNCNRAVEDGQDFGSSSILCVARDNDNRAPWIRISINLNSGSITRHQSSYDSYSTCRDSLSLGRRLNEGLISCVARDNDNRAPWIFSALTANGENRVSRPTFDSLSNCTSTLDTGRVSRSSLLVCVARDNDNRAPWIIGGIRLDGMFSSNNDTTFSSKSQCLDVLSGN